MPLVLDTSETADYVLTSDMKKEKNVQPSFTFRFVSVADWKKMRKAFADCDESLKANDMEGAVDHALKGIRIGIVGWHNMPFDFDPDKLADILTTADCIELRGGLLDILSIKEFDLKNSAWQSLRNTDKYAAAVANTENANATADAK